MVLIVCNDSDIGFYSWERRHRWRQAVSAAKEGGVPRLNRYDFL
jgi:hypothetical protein